MDSVVLRNPLCKQIPSKRETVSVQLRDVQGQQFPWSEECLPSKMLGDHEAGKDGSE